MFIYDRHIDRAYDGRVPGQVINRREQHKRHTRAALEEAAMGLFGRQGYERTTVEQIADQAGVSVRTFFRYFSSKQHVLFGDVAYGRVTALGEALAARPAAEPALESVKAVLDAIDVTDPEELAQIRDRMRLMTEQPALVATYLLINRELQERVAAFVAQRSGLSPRHPYPLMVSAAAASAWDAALMAWAAGQVADLSTARRQAFDQLSEGIRKGGPGG
jgi:TetR/AcrR family transcriptional regulator, regulator of mycofactocin system